MHGGGAMRWKAPELVDPEEFGLETTRPTFASDVFAFGCLCIEVRTSTMHSVFSGQCAETVSF